MTKTIALAALVASSLLVGNSVQAQNSTNTPPARAGQRQQRLTIEQLTTQLTLTDEQKPKVKAVLDEQQKKQTELRADTSMAQADRRAKTTEIRTATTAKLKEILTAEQFAKYEQLSPAPRTRAGAGAPPAAGGNKPAKN